MAESLPLPALLSQLLVAFTIEFDNEFENRMPHWTTGARSEARPSGGTWLVSQVMWANVLQYVDEEGISVAKLRARSRTEPVGLKGLERWRCVTLADAPAPDPAPGRPPGSTDGNGRPGRDDLIVRPAGVRIRDLARLTGVSKEANAMALGFLSRRGCVVLEPDPSTSRGKRARLTPQPRGGRASIRPPETLPYYPMVLHRGGYPEAAD